MVRLSVLAAFGFAMLLLPSSAHSQSFTTDATVQVHCSGNVTKDARGALVSCVLAVDALGFQSLAPGPQRPGVPCREGQLATLTPQGWLSTCTLSPHALTYVGLSPGPERAEIGCRTNAVAGFNAAGFLANCTLDNERTISCGPGVPEARFGSGAVVTFNGSGLPTSCPQPPAGAAALAVTLTSTASEIDHGGKVTTSAAASGGRPPYRYEWHDGKRTSHAVTHNVVWANLGAGPTEIRVVVTDAGGARAEASTQVVVRAAAAAQPASPDDKQQRDVFDCACRCANGVVGARYYPEVLRDSPSCEKLANGPCVGGTMGCERFKMATEGKCVAGCFEAAKVPFDEAAKGLLAAKNGGGKAAGGAPGAAGRGPIVNLALHKPALQSSMYSGTGIDQGPQFGVDGILESRPRDPYLLVITGEDNPPWWQVDLQAVHVLTKVVVYNRKVASERLRTVQVMLSNDGTHWDTAYQHRGAAPEVLTVDLKERSARYVRLQLGEAVQLHFHECEVYGFAN